MLILRNVAIALVACVSAAVREYYWFLVMAAAFLVAGQLVGPPGGTTLIYRTISGLILCGLAWVALGAVFLVVALLRNGELRSRIAGRRISFAESLRLIKPGAETD